LRLNIARLSVFDMSGNNKMKNKFYYKRQATDHESEREKLPPDVQIVGQKN